MNPILNKYPYFVVPAIEELQNASGEERVALVRRIAAAVGDPTALRTIIGVDPEEFLSFYPDMKTPELSTDDTIDSFIDRFGNPNTPKPTEVEDIITPVAVPYDLSSLEDLPELTNADLFPADLAPDIPTHCRLKSRRQRRLKSRILTQIHLQAMLLPEENHHSLNPLPES